MTYTVSSGTLNSTIPYHCGRVEHLWLSCGILSRKPGFDSGGKSLVTRKIPRLNSHHLYFKIPSEVYQCCPRGLFHNLTSRRPRTFTAGTCPLLQNLRERLHEVR